MSRSKHQRHKECRNMKCPRSILGRDSNGNIIWRKRKHKPYGLKLFTGYGDEVYSGKYHMEHVCSVVKKVLERKNNKVNILEYVDC